MSPCAGKKSCNKGHLQDIGETYTEHFRAAWFIWKLLFKATMVLPIHAVFPNFAQHYASNQLERIWLFKLRREENKQ